MDAEVIIGNNPQVLTNDIDSEIMEALKLCESKVFHRDEQGKHKETSLEPGIFRSEIRGTRCFMNLERMNATLAEKLTPPEVKFGLFDRVNLYVSPACTGAPLHFDICDIVIIQLSGHKLWQVDSKSAVNNPTSNTLADETAGIAWHKNELITLPEKMHFALLKPGDWLFIPRGTWHSTFSNQGSVSVTLAIKDARGLPNVLLQLLVNANELPEGSRLLY